MFEEWSDTAVAEYRDKMFSARYPGHGRFGSLKGWGLTFAILAGLGAAVDVLTRGLTTLTGVLLCIGGVGWWYVKRDEDNMAALLDNYRAADHELQRRQAK